MKKWEKKKENIVNKCAPLQVIFSIMMWQVIWISPVLIHLKMVFQITNVRHIVVRILILFWEFVVVHISVQVNFEILFWTLIACPERCSGCKYKKQTEVYNQNVNYEVTCFECNFGYYLDPIAGECLCNFFNEFKFIV